MIHTHTHTWATRWDESGPQLKSRGRENPRGLVSPSKAAGVGRIPRRTSGRWSLSPGMIPREWSSDIPGVRATIPGNSQLGVVGLPIPQKAAEEVLEAWYYTRHGRRVVLEAWYYTRHWCRSGPGGLVLHQGGWDRSDPRGGNWIPGNSRLYSSV